MNFDFLKGKSEYELFSAACIEAERTLSTSPAMCAVGCRKALELAVKWVYAADADISEPYKDNLQSLIHEPSFRFSVDKVTWGKLPYIVKLGNLSVHTERKVAPQDAMLALRSLFDFVQWLDYCYGSEYEERRFSETAVPAVKLALDVRAIKERESLIEQKNALIAELEAKVKAQQAQFAAAKAAAPAGPDFNPDEIPEYETRLRYIDLDLAYAGWDMDSNVETEVEVEGMPNAQGKGYVDYVLNGKSGKPLAIVEAKRTMYDAKKGLQQARLYVECLRQKYGYAPFIFLSNGFDTYFCDDETAPVRPCSGVFSRDDLQRMMNRRGSTLPLDIMQVNMDISGRYYQVEAIKAICANMEEGHRRSLLVMATGTGKTRTAAGLVDVLARSNHVTNVLFLADRIALVSQAKHSFQEYLPNMSLCNLCEARDKQENKDARIVFSTYPTILNAVDSLKTDGGDRLYTPAHFDLIVVDEAHRSIFKKYQAIFDYFDAQVVGLTATPKDEVDRNTYDFFEVERGVPTYVYEYDTAVYQDHFLVPYYNIEVGTKFLEEGIIYDDLSEEDKQRYDDDWEETHGIKAPDFTPSQRLNRWVFNEQTVDTVLQDLMENGIKVNGGERVGKTIIFAQNKNHAEFIVERFGKLYPKLAAGGFIRRVVHGDDYAHTVIDQFKLKELPVVTVSVDMMDTGIDVPEVLNLVFFKQVRSKTKFWQMIGRGTRLCPGIYAKDRIDGEYEDKRRFLIFDYCGNFEFFRQGKNMADGKNPESLSEKIFKRQAELVRAMQSVAYADADHQKWRSRIVYQMIGLTSGLKEGPLKASVKLHLHAVEKFSYEHAYVCLGDGDVLELQQEVAPLVKYDEKDQYALRFDALMYGYMVEVVLGGNTKAYERKVTNIALSLQEKVTIPQVKEKMGFIARVLDEGYLEGAGAPALDEVRRELRDLVKFLVDSAKLPVVITNLTDPATSRREGDLIDLGEDYADYKLKVNRFINEHTDHFVIAKLKRNIPMTQFELDELERIFTHELGTERDYQSAYGDTPFGLLVRKIAKLDHEAAMEAFAEFINDGGLSREQVAFVHKVVGFVEDNGYMEPAALMKAPFDRPTSFIRLFDDARQKQLIQIIKQVRDNATTPAA
ncbi:DEAD/DEAH box helicase family protein [Eggerthellaceae bacterium zg-1084]|uniref:DEAD/DEAH box helicase family protein n=1 Tax=Berryella wangjianweii TaxID=2734634 RepID=UPI0015553CE0|nr:DEAD/DEAH box helicase family protein [Berryella wangjianweii]NPD30992.1 DEAD/DEAH box helicase family protein [Berryella wangjianweii]